MSTRPCRPLTVRRFHTKSDVGFTILELLMPIVIIGIVSAVALVQIGAVRFRDLNTLASLR